MRKQGIFLEHRVQLSLIWGKIRNVLPIKDHLTVVRLFKTAQNTEGCRFAATTGA